MAPAAPIEPPFPESSSVPSYPDDRLTSRWLGDLRGVLWRIDLGILPSSPTSSVDHLRQVTANSRRRYAALRRRLLIDPQVLKDGSSSPHLVMDNPLSQNPDSMWSRFFRNAELERMLDQDLSRLYPEHGSYFQTPGCQGMLRRILLLWCLRHPDYGYRQGMHELLAPLLYVLHVDIEHLSEVRKLYEDHFTDKFDGFSFHESDLTYKFDFKKFSDCVEDETGPQKSPASTISPNELDPKIQAIISLCDAYGAEGELGVVVSEKFMEHDAYCMFDALMNGAGGAVAMAEFFSHSPFGTQHATGLPPVIEASSALYHLLSIVDSSLHSHLVELGVEPQYFALRWLRVLFGREFALEDLLIIWDEIFASDNSKILAENDVVGVLYSSRGAFISALAVSMILHLRSSLLATENATSCLQRLLNFPEDIKLEKLIAKAKSLQGLALNANNSTSLLTYTSGGVRHNPSKPVTVRGHTLSSDSVPERIAPSLVPESYWEEKWRVLHKEEERSKVNSLEKKVPNRIKGWSEKVKLRLSRTESDPSPSKVDRGKGGEPRSSVRRSLLKDLARQLGDEENVEDVHQREDGVEEEQEQEDNGGGSSNSSKNLTCSGCLNGNNGGSEENSSIFSDPPSPIIGGATNDHENESERSSVASNLYVDENFVEQSSAANSSRSDAETEALQGEEVFLKSEEQKEDSTGKSMTNLKDRKILLGKFQWLWKFGRNAGEGTSEKGGGTSEATSRASNIGRHNEVGSSTADGIDCGAPSVVISSRGGDAVDQNVKVTFKNLGQSMLENIQVIESAFQQDEGQAGGALENYSKNGGLVGRGQVTAMAALKELRKISNLLYEM